MNTNNLIVAVVLNLFLMSACVSTSTGSITEHERDDEDAAELNYQLGARYYNAGNYELARDRLSLATEIDPKMAVAYSTLGLTYEALDNLRLARDAYETSVRVAPRDFQAHNAYAVFLCRQKDYEIAHRHFAKAANHPENDNAEITLTNAGVCMMQKPDERAAEAFYRQALERKPKHSETLLQLCLLKYKQEDYLGARAFVQRLMSSSVSSPGVLYLAAQIEDNLDNDSGRIEFEDRLIRDFPTSPEARRVLGGQ